MSPRPRKPGNKSLAPNLSPTGNGYYRYRAPADIALPTGKVIKKDTRIGMGSDLLLANEAAHTLNSYLPTNPILARIVGNDMLFADFVDYFQTQLLPGRITERELSDEYVAIHYTGKFPKIKNGFAGKSVGGITVADVSRFLKQFTPAAANKYQSTLSVMFEYSIAEGLRTDNPALAVMRKIERKKRIRLNEAGFAAVYEHAPLWGKNAIDLALVTLQRRRDISVARFKPSPHATSWIDGDVLRVIQHKTKTKRSKSGKPMANPAAHLRIPIRGRLAEIIDRCRDDVLSPFVVHRKPIRVMRRDARAKGREHPTQIMPAELSRMFAEARDLSGFFKGTPEDTRPTFHEIRALGADILRRKNIDPQALLGHTTKKQTDEYLEGHEVVWTDIAIDF